MVFRGLKVITVLVVAVLIPISTMAGKKNKSLCDFFAMQRGNFHVSYILRQVNPGSTIYQNPDGGIRLELWLGIFDTEQQRQEFLKKIKSVGLVNLTTGDGYVLRSPSTWSYLGNLYADFTFWLGDSRQVVGEWRVVVVFKKGKKKVKYMAYFELTQEMLDQVAPIPVEVSVGPDGSGDYLVECEDQGADQYRLRVFDDEGIPWQTNMTCAAGICEGVVPAAYAALRARIEAIDNNQLWPELIQGGNISTCNSEGMNTGVGWARSSTWFDIE